MLRVELNRVLSGSKRSWLGNMMRGERDAFDRIWNKNQDERSIGLDVEKKTNKRRILS